MAKKSYLLELIISRLPELKGDEAVKLLNSCSYNMDSEISIKWLQDILSSKVKKNIKLDKMLIQAEKDSAACKKLGIKMVSWEEAAYPPLLREIFDPPVILFYRGCLPNPEKPMAAVVGTRKPSSGASSAAFNLGRELGFFGISVVSGLAMGIDSLAHRGNIEGRVPTVAVLGSSPEMIYPSSNRDLARRILDTGGLILSEYWPGTSPRSWTFPRRNRIISALARGTVIIEAPVSSGALITARFALEQNRDLWVHSIGVNSRRGGGTAKLANDGAGVISSASDIIDEWNIIVPALNNESRDKDISGAGLALSLAEYLDIKV